MGTLAGYCRYRNLRFNDPCLCDHGPRPTEGASYRLEELDLRGAKADDIRTSFLRTFPGGSPNIIGIRSIHNERLEAAAQTSLASAAFTMNALRPSMSCTG